MDDAKSRTRRRILEVAAELLERDGGQALSTRAVAAAAGIRAASLYQLFGDKDGLLSALAVHAFDLYLARKQTLSSSGDPVEDMRRGWDMHVDFGLRHPAFYVLMYGTDRPGRRPPAAQEAQELLMTFLGRAAAEGRLRVPPVLAAHLVLAAVTGVTLSLIGVPESDRDPEVSPRMREALIDALTTDTSPAPEPTLAARALTLDATLGEADPATVPLRPVETALLRDWLQQLAR
ncbi:AcrR family transcriptional regulator [Amycolatopsis bartoniae]|uniref:TetR family transcriptional regulator n=1 Tax=Amycolatopsis bartoniae TaxID=941986 RepID=A0A8H9IQG7_9PSEU|nr:TetR/AcrR family transcriptional regulator [Amycolatopsis bartoniae]MBB2939183.1 AcrR family transcriptional regulator [Amycolatopsis bartoniae]TVT09617.1 TetR/AcrR family transcriptional regulator [Amycolatopsis bartoniae]GHF38394.1 TetR family transcriptional regulator [Amycolatopsis bartoniae]